MGKTQRSEFAEADRQVDTRSVPRRLKSVRAESALDTSELINNLAALKRRLDDVLLKLTRVPGTVARPLHWQLQFLYQKSKTNFELYGKAKITLDELDWSFSELESALNQAEVACEPASEFGVFNSQPDEAAAVISLYNKSDMNQSFPPRVEGGATLVNGVYETPRPEDDAVAWRPKLEAQFATPKDFVMGTEASNESPKAESEPSSENSDYYKMLIADASKNQGALKDLFNKAYEKTYEEQINGVIKANEEQIKAVVRDFEKTEKVFEALKALGAKLQTSESGRAELQTAFENAYFEHQALAFELTKILESGLEIGAALDTPDGSLPKSPKNPFRGGEAFRNQDGDLLSREEIFTKAKEAILDAGHTVEGKLSPPAEYNLKRISDRINKVLMRRREAIDTAKKAGKSWTELANIKASFAAELDQEYEELGEIVAFYTENTPEVIESKQAEKIGDEVKDSGLATETIETASVVPEDKATPESNKTENLYHYESPENGLGVPNRLVDRFYKVTERLAELGFYPNNLVGVKKVRELFERMNEIRAYETDDGVYRGRIAAYVKTAEVLLAALEDENGKLVSETGLPAGPEDLNSTTKAEDKNPEAGKDVGKEPEAGKDVDKEPEAGKDIISMSPRREAMLAARESQKAYEKALMDHYQAEGIQGRLRRFGRGTKELFGLKPRVPEEIQILEEKAELDKMTYAKALHERLGERSKPESTKINPDSESTKKAFFKRFVADAAREQLALQKMLLSSEEMGQAQSLEKVKTVLATLGKHKWKSRIGMVLVVGALAGATGGLAAAALAGSYAAGRIATGAAAGTAGAWTANKVFGALGKRAEAQAAKVDEAGSKFVLDQMHKMEAEYRDTLQKVELIDKRRKVSAVTYGLAAGLAAGQWGFDAALEQGDNLRNVAADRLQDLSDSIRPASTFAVSNVEGVVGVTGLDTNEPTLNIEHLVQRDDTLSEIIHRHLQGQFDSHNLSLPEGVTREGLAGFMYEQYPELRNPNLPQSEWKLSPDQWRALGVESGNPHLIRPGDNINVGALIDKIAPSNQLENVAPSKPMTGPLTVAPDTAGGEIPILVDTPQPLEKIAEDEFSGQAVPSESVYVPPTIDSNPAVAATPQPLEEVADDQFRDQAAPPESAYVPSTIDSNAVDAGPRPFTVDGNFFAHPEYQEYVINNLGSFEAVERLLDSEIKSVEGAPSFTDMLLNRPRAFDLIKDFTVEQFAETAGTPGGLAELAEANGIQEKSLWDWKQRFDTLTNAGPSQMPYKGTTTFGDLFARSVVENHLNKRV